MRKVRGMIETSRFTLISRTCSWMEAFDDLLRRTNFTFHNTSTFVDCVALRSTDPSAVSQCRRGHYSYMLP